MVGSRDTITASTTRTRHTLHAARQRLVDLEPRLVVSVHGSPAPADASWRRAARGQRGIATAGTTRSHTGPVADVRIREWQAADLPAIGRLHATSRHHAYADLVDPDALAQVSPASQEAVWRSRWAELHAGAAHGRPFTALLAELDGEPVGFAVAFVLPQPDSGSEVELNALHVLPSHHGGGVAQRLMGAVVSALEAWSVDVAHLMVLEGNERAQAFYRRTGWVLRGTAGTHDVGGAQVPVLRYELRVR